MKSKKTILVMDDDPHSGAYLGDLIRYFGFDADYVETCASAMHRLREKPYDGLVLDMWMRDGTGRDMLSWLHQSDLKVPVVITSINADYDQWIDLVNHGAADLLAKPVEPTQLKRALQMAMGEEIGIRT